jgi:hypothetical protein
VIWRTVLAAVALLAVACAPVYPPSTTPASTPTDAAGYRAIWDANHPASYSYTIERTCFCVPLGPLAVTVEDGRVTSIVTADGKHLKPSDPRLNAYPISIDQLFDYATEAETQSARSEIGYDPTLGYPARLDIDWTSSTPDDDVQIRVSNFQPPGSPTQSASASPT